MMARASLQWSSDSLVCARARAITPALPRRFSRRCRSGSDSGAQALDAIAERGVLDLGDEDRGRVEGVRIPEVCAQHVGPDGELAHAGPCCERREIFDPLACAAMSRLNRGRSELSEGVRFYPYVGVGEACCPPPGLLEQAQAGGDPPVLAGDPAKALAGGPPPAGVAELGSQ